MKYTNRIFSLLIAVSACATQAFASVDAYLSIPYNGISKGASSANSIGQLASSDASVKDFITCLSVSQSVGIPMDPNSGVPTGARIFKPIVVTMLNSSATPLLFQTLANGTVIPQATIYFYRPDPSGLAKPQKYYSITLTNVTLTNIDFVKPNSHDPSAAWAQDTLAVSLAFKKIQWDQLISSTTASDSH